MHSGLGKLLLDIRKLNNIGRWSNEFLHMRPSVAEHSFAVAQTAQLLGIIEEREYGHNVDWKALYRKALNHDVIEAVTGDVISTTKNVTESARQAIHDVEEQLLDDIFLLTVEQPYKELYKDIIQDGKDSSFEGEILRAADNIDAMVECIQEIKLANKEPFVEKYFFILESIKRSKLDSVRYFIDEILPAILGDCNDIK